MSNARPESSEHEYTGYELSGAEQAGLVRRLEALDAELITLLSRRVHLSRWIGDSRVEAGLPRAVHERDLAMFARYAIAGACGKEVALLLLHFARDLPPRH